MGNFRKITAKSVTILEDAAESDAIAVSEYSTMLLEMPAAWTAANIGFKVCHQPGGTFVILRDAAGALIEIDTPVVSCAHPVPTAVFSAPYVKLWSQNGSGVDVTQAGDRAVVALLGE